MSCGMSVRSLGYPLFRSLSHPQVPSRLKPPSISVAGGVSSLHTFRLPPSCRLTSGSPLLPVTGTRIPASALRALFHRPDFQNHRAAVFSFLLLLCFSLKSVASGSFLLSLSTESCHLLKEIIGW